MKSRSKFLIPLILVTTMLILSIATGGCSSRRAGKDAAIAQANATAAQETAQQAQTNAAAAIAANTAAQQALAEDPDNTDLQQAAKAAAAQATAARAAFDQAIIAMTAANTELNKATDKYNKAVESDNSTWAMIAGIATPIGAAIGIPLGGLIDPFKKLVMGQQQGAAMATTAITNADTGNVLQNSTTREMALANLAGNPKIQEVVANHI